MRISVTDTAPLRAEEKPPPFVEERSKHLEKVPTSELKRELQNLRTEWPLGRGNLTHWIGPLNRFDTILSNIIDRYDLSKPQTKPFAATYILETSEVSQDDLKTYGYGDEADGELVEEIVRFTQLLMDKCANRKVYNSSEHLNSLLNSTSLPLIAAVLRFASRLAERYLSQVTRSHAGSSSLRQDVLDKMYRLSVDRVQKLALPFRPEQVADKRSVSYISNLAGFARGEVDTSGFGAVVLPVKEERTDSPSKRKKDDRVDQVIPIDATTDIGERAEAVAADTELYDVFSRLRVAKAMVTSPATRLAMLEIRILAIINLGYIYPEPMFMSKILQQDSEEPRRLQLAYQMVELVQPSSESVLPPLSIQIAALECLDMLLRHKARVSEVSTALSVNVNHGVLIQLVRRTVTELKANEGSDEWRNAVFRLLQYLPHVGRSSEAMAAAGLLPLIVEMLQIRTPKAEQNHSQIFRFLDSYVYMSRDAFQNLASAGGLKVLAEIISHEVELAIAEVEAGNGLPDALRGPQSDFLIPRTQQQTLFMVFKFIHHMLANNSGNFDRQLRNLIDSSQLLSALREVIKNSTLFGTSVWSEAVRILNSFINNEPTSYAIIAEAGLSRAVFESITGREVHEKPVESPKLQAKEAPAASQTSDAEAAKIDGPTDPASDEDMKDVEDEPETPALVPSEEPLRTRKPASSILTGSEAMAVIPQVFSAVCLNANGYKLLLDSKALDTFFEIFESSPHVASLKQRMQDAANLGASFDELVRHNPQLKETVVQCVINMLRHVTALLSPKPAVAKGKGKDVEMTDAGPSFDDETIMNHLWVIGEFLTGFFDTGPANAQFVTDGGIDALLKLMTILTNPPEFAHDPTCYNFAQVIHRLVEPKPYLALPVLVASLQEAADTLGDVSLDGDFNVGALTAVNSLTVILSTVLALPPYGHRPTSSPVFQQVNLTDLYQKLVGNLGVLQRTALCAFIQRTRKMNQTSQNVVLSAMRRSKVERDGAEDMGNYFQAYLSVNSTDMTAAEDKAETAACTLLRETAASIAVLFHELAKALYSKRSSDPLARQNATLLSNALADAVIANLKHQVSSTESENQAYWTWLLLRSSQVLLDGYDRPLVNTIVTHSFKERGGIDETIRIMNLLRVAVESAPPPAKPEQKAEKPAEAMEAESTTDQTAALKSPTSPSIMQLLSEHGIDASPPLVRDAQLGGVGFALSLFHSLCHYKSVLEAPQALALTSTRNGDRNGYEPSFTASQLLVDLRIAILPTIRELWDSQFAEVAKGKAMSSLIDTLKVILTGDGEHDFLARPRQPSSAKPKLKEFQPNKEHLEVLKEASFSEDLAVEALYRCNNTLQAAREYCEQVKSRQRQYPRPSSSASSENTGNGSNGETPMNIDSETEEPSKTPVVTHEGLQTMRNDIRKSLIDRCLDVIAAQSDFVFELAELIKEAILKGQDSEMRKDVGETLVQSLESLYDDDFRDQAERITNISLLLALLLQNDKFYDASSSTLVASFDTLLGFVKAFPDDKDMFWVGKVLLIIEKLLFEYSRPNIVWVKEGDEEVAHNKPGDITPEQFKSLFNAIMEILPLIGKNRLIATSVVRVLVVLTRQQEIALELGERQNLQRLFTMIHQLAGYLDDKLRGNILIVLRHIVEDESTLRKIMSNEIKMLFESKGNRPQELSSYIRSASALIVRNPCVFVEVTRDLTKIHRYESKPTNPAILLKPTEPKEPVTAPNDEMDTSPTKGKETADSQPAERGVADLAESTKENPEGKGDADAAKVDAAKVEELKPPMLDAPENVTRYLLSELFSYRDRDDPEAERKEGKPTYKAEENPVTHYRCFILQCLAELLACYNKTKVEFINFSRRSREGTPSKPRSSVLNYLLNDLVPIGTLETLDTLAFLKRTKTSQWAIAVIVSLCAKTWEAPYQKPTGFEEQENEPILVFVRKFALEQSIKAFKEAGTSSEELDARYARMLCLTDLFSRMLTEKPTQLSGTLAEDMLLSSQKQLAKIMFEKGYIPAISNSLAEIDLNFPGAKRAIKYMLRPLRLLTTTAIELSVQNVISVPADDEISLASSASDMDREEMPDLFRNSTLGMLEPGTESDSEDESDSEEDYDEYGDEMEVDYAEDESNASLDGVDPEMPMNIQVIMEHSSPEDMDDGEDDEDDEEEDGEDDDEDEDDDDDSLESDSEMEQDEEAMIHEGSIEEGEWESENEYPGPPLDFARGLNRDQPILPIDNHLMAAMDEDYLEEVVHDEEDDYSEEDEEDEDEEIDFSRYHRFRRAPWDIDQVSIASRQPAWSIMRTHHAYNPFRRHPERRHVDDSRNPLLMRSSRIDDFRPLSSLPALINDPMSAMPMPNPHSLINSLIAALQTGGPDALSVQRHHGNVHVTIPDSSRHIVPQLMGPMMHQSLRGMNPDSAEDDASFVPLQTINRWGEESRMLLGTSSIFDKIRRIESAILQVLVPPAREEERLRKAEAEKERKAAEEREKQVAKERAEKEAAEKSAREEEAKAAAEAEAAAAQNDEEDSGAMEVEPTEEPAPEPATEPGPSEPVAGPSEPEERRMATIRGREIDVTDLDIDPGFLDALPDDLREEVLLQQIQERRQTQTSAGEQPTDISREFLDALPEEIREELLQQEAQDRRRREREAARVAQGEPQPAELDVPSFLATLDPNLRQTILTEQDDAFIAQLPPVIAAEANALRGDRREINIPPPVVQISNSKQQKTSVVQMLDKSGVATLLRLMFIPLTGSAKTTLNSVLSDISENRQTRQEVVSMLLAILQNGTTDMIAVEKSFTQLSLRARNQVKPKRLSTTSSEMSPIMVVQQCLGALMSLAARNSQIPWSFLTEHDPKRKKGKEKEALPKKYAINSLLSLLDRPLIMENSAVMELLSSLLNTITNNLAVLHRKDKERERLEKEKAEKEKQEKEKAEQAGESSEVQPAGDTAEAAPASEEQATTAEPEAESKPEEDKAKDSDKADLHRKALKPPVIPPENLRLVVNILAARECSGKTFRETLSTMLNLALIPEARDAFGEELVRQAHMLGKVILENLQELLPHMANEEKLPSSVLAAFSKNSSDQTKLLRVLTALDYVFDPKRTEGAKSSTLFEQCDFGALWSKLSECLSAKRPDILNVATILQPLIESLMVVCKNTTDKAPSVDGLFFAFTEEHRKILNELVRQSPKLMSGTFSVLVKNPKVLEFDNKRNYFTRQLHARTDTRHTHHTLPLHVRRDQVFLDSYKALYFKKGDEIKYAKLNIRFHGEEGIDAGGVTREWFQVLSRQMFNPDYALFKPVASDRTTFHPNHMSSVNQEHLDFFKFIGRIIGKALYEGRVLDCHFSRAVYKQILGKNVSIKDMETLDLDYYKSLVWMLENDITDIITENFAVEIDEFGVMRVHDLIPNGRNIAVTEDNKHEYVRLMTEYRLVVAVKEQLEHFLKGFHDIIPAKLIQIFNEQELELLISGLPDIDVDDWKSNAEYHNYSASSPQIQWFWRAVRSFDKEERAKLLQFVTGTSKVPLNGFKELEGMNGISKFNIHRDYGSKDRLPSSHTCFNQLDLPEYESYESLRKLILTAITQGSEYFGFA